MKENRCDCIPAESERVESVRKELPDMNDIIDLADFFKIMGDSTRLQILMVLIHDEFCVTELAYMLGMSHSAVSHQLKSLKTAKLVKTRREGKSIYYSLDDSHIKDILAEALIHVIDC